MSAPDGTTPGTGPGIDVAALAQALADAMSKATGAAESALGDIKADLAGPRPPFFRRFSPRLLGCLLLAVVLAAVVALISPQQVPVAAYKLCLVTMGGCLGYWLDRWTFPYSRPDGYLCRNWQGESGFKADAPDHAVVPGYELVFALALIRRALIMLAVVLAIGMAL